MSVDNRIHYLQGVIDTLSQIIAQNTNIKLNLDFQQIIKDEYVEKSDTLNHIESIDTAKNYIQLLERARANREHLLSKVEIQDYISELKKNVLDTIEKLKARGLDEKKINNLIRNNFLRPIDSKLLLDYKYENIILTHEDINYLRDSNKIRYGYKKYKVFNREKFINSFLNYTISIFNIEDMIKSIVNNNYCNIKYIPQKTSKMDDPFSFYYIQKIDDKIHWQMDCRLLSISNDLRFSCIEYCINLFRKIYNDIFHDNDYRYNFERDKEILEYECMHLLKNIKILSSELSFNKLFQKILIDGPTESPNHDKFKYNLKGDDVSIRDSYKELDNNDEQYQEEIYKLFDNLTEDNFKSFVNKIEII